MYTSHACVYVPICRSIDDQIVAIRAEIKGEFTKYFDAIVESIQTAQDGYTFATDGISLCRFIGEDRPLRDITSFINDMVFLAKEAHAKAKSTSGKFRTIRTKLYEVCQIDYC